MTNYQLLPRACVIIPRMSVTPPTRLRGAHQNGRILLFMAGCVLVGALGTGAVLVRLGRFPNLAFGPPTATPIPLARITDADQELSAGDWPGALASYQAVLDQSSDPALVQAARLG